VVEHKREAAELQTHMWKRERKVEKTLKGQEEMKLPEGCERKGGKTLRDWGAREKVEKLSGIGVRWCGRKRRKNSQGEEKIGIGGG